MYSNISAVTLLGRRSGFGNKDTRAIFDGYQKDKDVSLLAASLEKEKFKSYQCR